MTRIKVLVSGVVLMALLAACGGTTHHTHSHTSYHGGSGCHSVTTVSHHKKRFRIGKRAYYKVVTTRSSHMVCH
ncbi:MAG TPA: hypothetical protein VIY48_00065 [Candidatus Paceibacterota bacterium]